MAHLFQTDMQVCGYLYFVPISLKDPKIRVTNNPEKGQTGKGENETSQMH